MVSLSPLTGATLDETSVFSFKKGQGGVEQVAVGDDDDVEPRGDLVATENLSYQSFGAISTHSAAQLLRRRDAQPATPLLVAEDERRAVAAPKPNAPLVHALELGAPPDVFMRAEPTVDCQLSTVDYSLLTVRRLRPFARRRFRTRRPFLVLMRTRKPCARARWRVLG
jgi:hypothetical protein